MRGVEDSSGLGVHAPNQLQYAIAPEHGRFDVPLPPGARLLSLCATDAGDGSREDLADWVDAGFIRRQA